MVGGPRSPSMYRHRFRSPSSYQIQEGETINIDITSPGATLALGLMFFNSGNKTYANWMNAPDSQFLLEFVRPDFLMVRTLAKRAYYVGFHCSACIMDRVSCTSID